MGVLMHLLIMRPLRKATVLSRMIATLGVLLFLRELALRRWTSAVRVVSSDLPRGVFHTIADTNLGKAQLYPLHRRRRADRRPVVVLLAHALRPRLVGGCREPGSDLGTRLVAGRDRGRQLGRGRRARRARRDLPRPLPRRSAPSSRCSSCRRWPPRSSAASRRSGSPWCRRSRSASPSRRWPTTSPSPVGPRPRRSSS